jgi:adenine-specific DNA-methyltransferase
LDQDKKKTLGAYYTPEDAVRSLVAWATRSQGERMLDPSCGDGRFLVAHHNSVGVEHDPEAAHIVHQRAPGSLIHQGDFFAWAAQTQERFDCAAGNPPFIRYQRFTGEARKTAQALCAQHGAHFSALSSSWAPFIVATSTLLKPGGRMAFVVPAEIGHAPYAAPVIEHLAARFERVQIVAIRKKLFPELSEDCWLLYADGHTGATGHILFSPLEVFAFMPSPPAAGQGIRVRLEDWRAWGRRLRSFLLPAHARELYAGAAQSAGVTKLGDIGKVGIGYVTGANAFFHLRPSEARQRRIPSRLLVPAVRNGRMLADGEITPHTVDDWRRRDDEMLLLRLRKGEELPRSVRTYLQTEEAKSASASYKCRNRDPWYVVPDVTVPDAFLSYMSSDAPHLVANGAGCVGTNSVHVVHLKNGAGKARLLRSWSSPLTRLSCEIEGHALGGGLLKLEPREAAQVLLPAASPAGSREDPAYLEGAEVLKRWRHHGG